jgi:hypothetical protein
MFTYDTIPMVLVSLNVDMVPLPGICK